MVNIGWLPNFRFRRNPYSLSIGWMTGLFGPIMERSWKIFKQSLSRKIFENYHFVQHFLPVPEMISNIQYDPSPLGYVIFFFFKRPQNTQFELMQKIFEHWHFVQNFPPFLEKISKIPSDPSPLGYGFFSSNGL